MDKSTLTLLNEILDDSWLYLEDSSSSDDTSDDEKYFGKRLKRTSIQKYFEEVVPKYRDDEFIKYFRINRDLFYIIASKFKENPDYKALDSSKSYSAEKHIAVFLWFAGHEACSFRDLSNRFNISISTVSLMINRVTYFISGLGELAFKWPNEEEKAESAEFFKAKHGFPGIIGAIDGTHIIIDPPKRSKDDYLDRKNRYSICLQGICNEKRKFIDVFIGFPGSVHDSRVLKNSDIYPKLDELCKGYHILGDSAYPCSRFLLTPFKDNGHLSAEQVYFNKCLSSSRVVIEHSFGILKQRFRQLYYCKLRGIEKMCHFIRACCILHNLSNEREIEEVETTVTAGEDVFESSNGDNTAGKRKRMEICNKLYSERNIQ